MYALVDCNNFYASCERVFRPELNDKPVVILSNNDGCIIARSNEAKALGIPMGAPLFQYKKMLEQNGVYVFSANFQLYGDMSQRVMKLLTEYTPEIEIYSIDEAFLKLQGFDQYDLNDYGAIIYKRILKSTGIPISIGIAPSKSLAKVANRVAKKFPLQTKGTYLIDSTAKREKALKWLKVEDVWGIGARQSRKLRAVGINTAYEFTQIDSKWVKNNMTIVGLRLQKELQGKAILDLETYQAKKNIATTRSFESTYKKLEELEERIVTFAVFCAEKLRKQNSCCKSIVVFIRTNVNRKDLPQNNRSSCIRLPFPTNSNIELSKFAILALKSIFKEGYAYKKAGVIVQDFIPENNLQRTLFENRSDKQVDLMKAVDRINATYGQQKIRLASQDLKRVWKMKQERLSPCYTTKLEDIIKIKC